MTAVLRTRACSCIHVVVGAKLCGRWYTWPASVWVCCKGRHSFVTGFLFDLCSLHNWVIECLTIAAGRMHENIVALCMAAPAYAISLLCIAQRAADCPLNSTCTLSLYHFRVGIKKLFHAGSDHCTGAILHFALLLSVELYCELPFLSPI